MGNDSRVLEVIYALKQTDKSGDFFNPVIETNNLIWNFKIREVDKLGLLLGHLEIKAKNPPALSLEKQFELLKNKITYLEEDFKLVEQDRAHRRIILRSNVPYHLKDRVSYYEILLKGGDQLSFDRYEVDKTTGKRQSRPANLARETFERLVADFESLFS